MIIKVVTLIILFAISTVANATLINGGFEDGLTSWSSSGTVSVDSGFVYSVGTVNPYEGSQAAHMISTGTSASTLASLMGVDLATLQASNSGITATYGSMIYQSSQATTGDSFIFNWNFVEQDYVPYDDWAFYGISIDGGPASITKFASLASVGPGSGSTINGWEELTVNITQDGSYTFYFGVVNALDNLLNSDLWIDGVGGTGTLEPSSNDVPEPTTIAIFGLGFMILAVRKYKKMFRGYTNKFI